MSEIGGDIRQFHHKRHKSTEANDRRKYYNCRNDKSVKVVRLAYNIEIRDTSERQRRNEKRIEHSVCRRVELYRRVLVEYFKE